MQSRESIQDNRTYNQQVLRQLYTELEFTESSENDIELGGPWFWSISDEANSQEQG